MDRAGRMVMSGYVALALALTLWALRGVPLDVAVWTVMPMAAIAGCASLNARRLVSAH